MFKIEDNNGNVHKLVNVGAKVTFSYGRKTITRKAYTDECGGVWVVYAGQYNKIDMVMRRMDKNGDYAVKVA